MFKILLISIAALLFLGLAGFGLWMASLPSRADAAEPPAIAAAETEAMLAALRPEPGKRPLIAIVGINDATETTDYLMPAGILRRADIADVVMLATEPGPVQLFPALRVEPDATIAEFDAAHPEGADYVIVPAMSRDDDPAIMAWLQQQSQKGAMVIGICAGAKVVAAAGLLDGRQATTHWYYLNEMLKRHPDIDYVADRRMVVGDGVATTTGITASMPMMLTLVEAIAGRAKAEALATELGIAAWDARHASQAFRFTRDFAGTVLLNSASFWAKEKHAIRLEPGMDEVSLALVADAWSRTYRSSAVTLAGSDAAVVSAQNIRILPDNVDADWPAERLVTSFPDLPPAKALDRTLETIASRYGQPTMNVVAMQLEYPQSNLVQ